ncbi:TetR/AcrR family transcriptional regulator [Thalassomonas viridans]|uniref:TetR/AcrR family transcriptional regulator n=1 Tax=Thalassomonas viridans TaxID=137584 RepID=A0AAF0C7M9_9GAMM|nr:TetR/AcrR family transcriptional regulator [Thalassomonas viridans]WDE03511.1 TetR/AcrR family transcriptional regulator [Thalassomonas viridans]
MEKKITQSERKRAAILAAAIEEFRDKGFRAASMDSLAARAQVSKRTVYNHFASKEVLFQAIAQQLFDHSAQMTRIRYQSELPLTQQLMEFADKELDLLASAQFRDLAKIMIGECIHSPELAANTMAQLNKQEISLEQWIADAVDDGKLKPVDPAYATGQFIALIKGNAFWPQITMGQPIPDKAQKQQIAEDTVGMFLAYYAL